VAVVDRIAISLSVSRQAAWERCHEVDGPAGDKSVTDHAFLRPGDGRVLAPGQQPATSRRVTSDGRSQDRHARISAWPVSRHQASTAWTA